MGALVARRLPLLVALLVLTACASDGPPILRPAPTTSSLGPPSSAPPVPTTAAGPPGVVTLLVTDLRLINSEESDNAFRVLIESAAPAVAVKVTGVPTPNLVVLVCPVDDLGRRSAPAADCVTPASGETVQVPHRPAYRGVEIVQVGVSSGGPAGNSTAVSEIAIRYPATSREADFRLPALQEGESGSRPLLKMTPAGSGAYSATATFTAAGGGPGEAELTLVSDTANQNTARGPGPSLSGNLIPPAEAGFRIRNRGSTALLGTTLDVLFP